MFKEPEKPNMDVHTFLNYLKHTEQCNLTPVLSLAPKKGANYTIRSLKDAGFDEHYSTKLRMDIYEEKSKQSEIFCKSESFSWKRSIMSFVLRKLILFYLSPNETTFLRNSKFLQTRY